MASPPAVTGLHCAEAVQIRLILLDENFQVISPGSGPSEASVFLVVDNRFLILLPDAETQAGKEKSTTASTAAIKAMIFLLSSFFLLMVS